MPKIEKRAKSIEQRAEGRELRIEDRRWHRILKYSNGLMRIRH